MLIAIVDSSGNVVKVLGTAAGKMQVEADIAASQEIEVTQGTAADLKATVTQAAKDRTVTCDTADNLKNTEVNSGDIKTAVETLDDIVETEDTGHSTGDKGVMLLAVRKDSAASLVSDDLDYSPIIVDANGRLHMIMTPANDVDLKVTLDSEQVDIGDISKGTQTNDVKVTLDSENVGTTEASASAIKSAVELIDDVIATHDSAATAKAAQIAAAYDSTKPAVTEDGDATRILSDQYGRLLAGMEPERFQATITSADAQSATQVKAKTADRKMYILSLVVSTDTAMEIQFQDDAGTPAVLIEGMYFAANGGAALIFPPQAPLVVTTNQDFDVIASAAGNISVTITGYLAP